MTKRSALFGVITIGILTATVSMSAFAMNGLSSPMVCPMDIESQFIQELDEKNELYSTQWCGVYYAEGYGFDLTIEGFTSDNGLCYEGWMQNYCGGSYQSFTFDDNGDGSLVDYDGGIVLSRIDADHIHVEFGDDFYGIPGLYMDCQEAELLRVNKLAQNTSADKWNGAYYYDDNFSDTRYILNVKQLYGTDDYMTYLQIIQRNVELDSGYIDFYTQKGNILVKEMPANGVVLMENGYFPLTMDADENIHSYEQVYTDSMLNDLENEFSQTYERVADYPLWETDADGFIY